MNKLVCGIGINDLQKSETLPGVRSRWQAMLSRCSPKHPRYKGCEVSQEWSRLSGFQDWIKDKNLNWQIDKDLKELRLLNCPEPYDLDLSPSDNFYKYYHTTPQRYLFS